MKSLSHESVSTIVAAADQQHQRMKPTIERINDLRKLYVAMRLLAKSQVVIHHFMSTDTKPVIYAEAKPLHRLRFG